MNSDKIDFNYTYLGKLIVLHIIIIITMIRKICSKDGSFNLIRQLKGAHIESRYVQRKPNYISLYLSSHNGCKMACRFCWLTQQKQTDFHHLKLRDYQTQLKALFNEIAPIPQKLPKKDIRINLNLMARGEPLANKNIIKKYPEFQKGLELETLNNGYKELKINLSTIMPYTVKNRSLESIFQYHPVAFYYSLYSMKPEFRQKWIPNAIEPQLALDKLKEYQELSNQQGKKFPITFHWTFIEGENDNPEDLEKLLDCLESYKFTDSKFNLVRYNRHPNLTENESPQYKELFEIVQKRINGEKLSKEGYNPSQVVSRVGYEAYVSCGMFILF